MSRARTLADYVSSGDELALKAPIAGPTFTGTVGGLGTPVINLGSATGAIPAGVTGGAGLTGSTSLGTVTVGNISHADIVYPAGHIVQTKTIQLTARQLIGNGVDTGTTFVTIGTGDANEFETPFALSHENNKLVSFGFVNAADTGRYGFIKIFAASTQIACPPADGDRSRVTMEVGSNNEATNDTYKMWAMPFNFVYLPGTTNSITYKIQGGSNGAADKLRINQPHYSDSDASWFAIGISTWTLMEVVV